MRIVYSAGYRLSTQNIAGFPAKIRKIPSCIDRNAAENILCALFCSLELYIIHKNLDTKSYIMYTRRNKGVRTGRYSARLGRFLRKNSAAKTADETHELAKSAKKRERFDGICATLIETGGNMHNSCAANRRTRFTAAGRGGIMFYL